MKKTPFQTKDTEADDHSNQSLITVLIAEAAHSWADTGNGTLWIVAEKKSNKPADADHPLGYGKEAYVWSMIAAFGVFTAGAIVSIYTGIKEWIAEEAHSNYTLGFAILGIAFVLEGILMLSVPGAPALSIS